MKKVLFLIHDLGNGGAEKVLVNLVNNIDRSKFDITVMSLFGGGVNEQFLKPHIHYIKIFKKEFKANSKIMKLFSPKFLHKFCIKGTYDIEVSYLEGPSARIISGCSDSNTKIVSWIHTKFKTPQDIYSSFRNKAEAEKCYRRFDYTAFVSADVCKNFLKMNHIDKPNGVIYNTIESDEILTLSKEQIPISLDRDKINIVAVGTMKEVKGYDRLLKIVKKLSEQYSLHLYLLGIGPLEQKFKKYVTDNNLEEYVTFLGFDSNPYKYVAKCDLFVCSSYTEGFSTAATEALIVGTPVCTVEVSGMKEMLGENNEFGVVTANTEEGLYDGIKSFLNNPELLDYYKEKAFERGKVFSTSKTVQAVENLLLNI